MRLNIHHLPASPVANAWTTECTETVMSNHISNNAPISTNGLSSEKCQRFVYQNANFGKAFGSSIGGTFTNIDRKYLKRPLRQMG
jgi:hypothetical protein